MQTIRSIIRFVLGAVVLLWLLTFMLPRIPAVQTFLGEKVSTLLAETLGTNVSVGRIDLQLPSRIIVDELQVADQQGRDMLRVGRVAVSVDILPLLDGKIRLSSAQLFGLRAHITQRDAQSPLNCQFVIDSLQSKDTLSHTPLDLHITSFIIRHGEVTYDRFDMPPSHGFSPYHVNLSELSTNIKLNRLTDDSLHVDVKRMSFVAGKGTSTFHVKNLALGLSATKGRLQLRDFQLLLPHSELRSPQSSLLYTQGSGSKLLTTIYDLNLTGRVTPSDFAWFYPRKIAFNSPITLNLSAKGTERQGKAAVNISTGHNDISLNADATLYDILNNPHADIHIHNLRASESTLAALRDNGLPIPAQVMRLGSIDADADVHLLSSSHISGKADVRTSKAGQLSVTGDYNNRALTAHVVTPHLDLAQITAQQNIGTLSCDLNVKTSDIGNIRHNTMLKGTVKEFTYNHYTYRDVFIDGRLTGNIVSGTLNANDPNARIQAKGTANIATTKIINADIDVRNFSPKQLHLTSIFGDTPVNAHLSVTPSTVDLTSNIADMSLQGDINVTTLPQSFINIIASRLPSVPGLPKTHPTSDNFVINTRIKDLTFLKSLTTLPLEFSDQITINGYLNAPSNSADLNLATSSIEVGGHQLHNATMHFFTPDNTLHTDLVSVYMKDGIPMSLGLNLIGRDNELTSTFAWDNKRERIFRGKITADTRFYNTPKGKTALSIAMTPSNFEVGDSLWTIQSKEIRYEDGIVNVSHFYVGNDVQHVSLNGTVSPNPADSLVAELSNANISYILNLVNFHSVEFDGRASGRIVASAILGNMVANAHLYVRRFLFEQGNLGNMTLDASYTKESGKILIDGICDDREAYAQTLLNGYVIPSPGEIFLDIRAQDSRLEFMESFCGSFMGDTNLRGTGNVLLFGPFSNINLQGKLYASGSFTLKPTNCRYTLPGDSITFIPDDIQFHDLTLYDPSGNSATLTGAIHHRHLTQMSYDLWASTSRFLAYDIPTLRDEETFCGRATINGDISIHGKGNELMITADALPLAGTYLTYNASSPDAIRSGDIITWRSAHRDSLLTHDDTTDDKHSISLLDAGNDRTNIRFDFNIHANPDARLHLIMDQTTGDFVDLFGNGDLQVKYYNKGSLDIFGNYTVSNGKYKMTIQNLLRRDFTFQQGGTITFGGDPYDALLNMKAVYALNSVPLADLNIGSAFTANNVPVNCIMNISGTPGKPSVTFDLNLPSLSTDARQMVNAIINSQEEMNQQVLYLLAIGRFYAPSNATAGNSSADERNIGQGTLAVQSFLSGTLSQQFNNVMSNVMGNILGAGNSLSFGANIAPGNEGFSNAEYEGLLSGRLFNNRLIFNGQFGYRDNINKNSHSFIGDFSVQYMLTKNGVISLKVYNQSNDRYFTRNALNTQGIGIVIQKEFGK